MFATTNSKNNRRLPMITFDLTTRDVLTATKDGDIYIRANLCEDDKDRDIIAICTRKQWNGLMDEFFESKAGYNTRWNGDFCGVETIFAYGKLLKDKKMWLTTFDVETEEVRKQD